jgi:hypothetical protein
MCGCSPFCEQDISARARADIGGISRISALTLDANQRAPLLLSSSESISLNCNPDSQVGLKSFFWSRGFHFGETWTEKVAQM